MKTFKYRLCTALPGVAALAAGCLVSTAASAETVNATWNSAAGVPITANGYTASGKTVKFTLNSALATGTDLMVVKNTSLGFIVGTFGNLTQGQTVALSYGGTNYHFVANYCGGSGNDLVLVWANNRALAWGANDDGQLGDSTSGANRLLPVPVTATGVLASKTVMALAAGGVHSLALCSDGTVAAWGLNLAGQLGDNQVSVEQSLVPAAVNTAAGVSALSGKTVVAIAAGSDHSLALCSDGTVAAWGWNYYGQLGDTTGTDRFAPVAVNTAAGISALTGKTAVAIAAGFLHTLALCSDGTVAAWGYNDDGELGDTTTTQRNAPVAVNTAAGVSALSGKTVVAIAAGQMHSLALCSDGTVAAWGYGGNAALGNNDYTNSYVPVAVDTTPGVSALYGKTVVAIAAGSYHTLALCSDGTVAAWGDNEWGQLGDDQASGSGSSVPVAVNTTVGVSALHGKTVVAIAAGAAHSLALCSDGTVAAWGGNDSGQLGDNTTTNRLMPVAVNTTPLATGERLAHVFSGPIASHTLAVVAEPLAAAPGIVTLLSPTNNAALFAHRPQFSWTQSDFAATWFYLWLNRNGSKYLDRWIQGATNWTSGVDLPVGSYTWAVQTWNPYGYGPWSAVSSFTIAAAVPANIVLVSPISTAPPLWTERYTWRSETNATWYEVYINRNGSLFVDKWYALGGLIAATNAGTSAVEVSGHSAGNYQWRVRGWSPDGYGGWSSVAAFTLTNPPLPDMATLLTPGNGSTIFPTNGLAEDRHPQFSWSAPANGDWYHLWLNRNGVKYLDTWMEGATNWVPGAELPSGSYTWAVEGWNLGGYGSWSAVWSFTIQAAAPAKITLLSPSGTVAAASTQRYTWQADGAASWYELYINRNSSRFLDQWYGLSNSVVVGTTNFAVDVAGGGTGSYRWWVRGWSPDGYGPWSDALSFTSP